ncbi:MAG: GGDEF domain-containing protein, partial [Oscillospiraceae bacterium]
RGSGQGGSGTSGAVPHRGYRGARGGDEFVAYLHSVDDPEIAAKKAAQVCEMFRRIQLSSDRAYRLSGSVGVALFPTQGDHFAALYQNADRALYRAKELGRDTYSLVESRETPPFPPLSPAAAGQDPRFSPEQGAPMEKLP